MNKIFCFLLPIFLAFSLSTLAQQKTALYSGLPQQTLVQRGAFAADSGLYMMAGCGDPNSIPPVQIDLLYLTHRGALIYKDTCDNSVWTSNPDSSWSQLIGGDTNIIYIAGDTVIINKLRIKNVFKIPLTDTTNAIKGCANIIYDTILEHFFGDVCINGVHNYWGCFDCGYNTVNQLNDSTYVMCRQDGTCDTIQFALGVSVDTLWRVPGIDSIYFSIDGRQHAIKDSTGGGGGGGTLTQVIAQNGLSNVNDSTIELGSSTPLGAPLLHDTYIEGANFSLTHNNLNLFSINGDSLLVGINTTTPRATQEINGNIYVADTLITNGNTDHDRISQYYGLVTSGNAATTQFPRALYTELKTAGTTDFTGGTTQIMAGQSNMKLNTNLTIRQATGFLGRIWAFSTDSVLIGMGLEGAVDASVGANLRASKLFAVSGTTYHENGTITADTLAYFGTREEQRPGLTENIQNKFGLFLHNYATGGHNNWGIYQQGSTHSNYFEGTANYFPNLPTGSNTDSLLVSHSGEVEKISPNVFATGTIGAFANGNGTVVTAGSMGFITIPYNCTITNWYVAANLSGTIQFDLKRSGTSIIGAGNHPALSSAISGNAAAASWTSVTVTAGDILEWVVDASPAPATLTNCSVVLKVIKN